jgi:hypothetical protein
VQIRTNSVGEEGRQFLAATRFEDRDLKGRVASACEDKEVILL